MNIDEQVTSELTSFLNIGEKGTDCLVFQLGSHSIKFGLASQLQPFVIPNCIAYKKYKIEDQMIVDSEPSNTNKGYEINDVFLSNLLNIEQETIKKMIRLEQKIKGKKPIVNKPYTNVKVY